MLIRHHRTLSLGALLCIDTFYFGQLTFTPWNFFMANLSISSYYGVNQWHYYITQALPILCTTALPFVIHGVYTMVQTPSVQERHRYQTLLGVIGFTIAVYSLGQHKEWRFIHPLLPLLHVCAAKSLADLKSSSPSNAEGHNTKVTKQGWLPIRPTHLALMLLNIPAILYVILLHGRAQISVMHYLRSLPPVDLQSVGFLMPCHSTPWQAYLHRPELASPKAMWALTCEPPLK
jgi:phosphatidylinositol glycan class B